MDHLSASEPPSGGRGQLRYSAQFWLFQAATALSGGLIRRQQPRCPTGLEADENVDVAVRPEVVAQDRSEQRQLLHYPYATIAYDIWPQGPRKCVWTAKRSISSSVIQWIESGGAACSVNQ